MSLAENLESRINPERSRKFSAAEFARSLERLDAMAQKTGIVDSEKSIHVVGTNGKGSTSWFLSAILSRRSQTGLYTSPHLLHFTERIRIDQKPASEVDLLAVYKALCDQENLDDLTYFELLTMLAGAHFTREGTKWRVYEAGLGGRLDATRIFKGRYAVLTQIDLDHTAVLGSTPREILKEKIGVCSDQTKLLIAMRQRYFSAEEVAASAPCEVVTFEPARDDFATYLEYNQAFARFAAGFICPGIDTAELPPMPGRLEMRRSRGKTLVFDHAHNPAAIEEVIRSVRRMPGCPQQILLALGVLPDRSADDCMKAASAPGVRVIQIESDFFQTLPGAGIRIEKLGELLAAPETWLVFLGSHRLYSAFLDLNL
jgi:dihydrofolate synthase/folylpolyglutamate synthase